jgi:hypothetical protein
MAVTGIANAYIQLQSWEIMLINTGVNIGFLACQFLLLQLYFLLKQRSWKTVINRQIGWGDILFLAASCCFFSPANFLLFYCLGLLFVLIVHLAVTAFTKNKQPAATIPLAGYQAIFLLVFTGAYTVLHTTITNDNWLINTLSLHD